MRSSFARAEPLESRRLLSVGISLEGGILTIDGDSAAQVVQIHDLRTATLDETIVSVDLTGNGSVNDVGDFHQTYQGITEIVANLRGGNDVFRYAVDILDSVDKTIRANLGGGDDQFGFAMPMATWMTHSNLEVDVSGGAGNDWASTSVNKLTASQLGLRMDLGEGNDRLSSSYYSDIAQSRYSLLATLGNGDDEYSGHLDYEGLDIYSGGFAIDVLAGSGNDSLTVYSGNSEMGWSAHLGGSKSIALQGESGDDAIRVTLPEADFMGSTQFQLSGGAGRDDIEFTFGAIHNPTVDVLIRGGPQRDALFANVSGVSGEVTLNGGSGIDECATDGDAAFVILNCEA